MQHLRDHLNLCLLIGRNIQPLVEGLHVRIKGGYKLKIYNTTKYHVFVVVYIITSAQRE